MPFFYILGGFLAASASSQSSEAKPAKKQAIRGSAAAPFLRNGSAAPPILATTVASRAHIANPVIPAANNYPT